MASSRQMRSSRRASPLSVPTPNESTHQNVTQFENNQDTLEEEWIEPPLRTPVPSFMDYKGIERHGVLEHMQPLGTFPSAKVKARLKQYDAPRRTAHLKNGELRALREDVKSAAPAPQIDARKSEPLQTDDRARRISSSRARDDDQDYTPTLKNNTRAGVAKSISANTMHHSTPSSRTAQGRQKLKDIVDSAVARSNELGDPVLGEAVNDLYEESLRNPAVAGLLDAVLTQKPSPEQTAEFQNRIRAARKKHRDNSNGHRSASKPISNPPIAKSSRSSVARHLDSANLPSNSSILINHSPTSIRNSPKRSSDTMEANGTSLHDEHVAKRVKHSPSASSSSSLSSLDSDIDEEPPPTTEANHLSDLQIQQSKSPLSNGPILGTFPIKSSDSSGRKPTLSQTHLTSSADDAAAKKREEMRQRFNRSVGVWDSSIRPSHSPVLPSHPSLSINSLAEGNHKGRLQNISDHKRKRHEYEPLDSPASSNFGELLVPPPEGASRGATPGQLSRPSKARKTAARIKLSPVKKRTTAGRGVESDSVAVSNARATNNQSDGNADLCIACSGDGNLLCCDGCFRAYHLSCCDPPMEQSPENNWYCNKCSGGHALPPPSPGLFNGLVGGSSRKNTSAFALPAPLRNYFENVVTGEDGEFEEAISSIKPKKSTRGGYEEPLDSLKIKDGKEISCFSCSGTALPARQSDDTVTSGKGGRELIHCDYCDLHWHLDCLDPPLAAPPRLVNKTGAKTLWRCPVHINSQLNNLKPRATTLNKDKSIKSRSYKLRRPRNAIVRDSTLSRGLKNNGLVEIVNEISDDEISSPRSDGPLQIFRAPERGIKLDFIDRVKAQREEEEQNARLAREAILTAKATELDKRPFAERQAACNLVQMARVPGAVVGSDSVENLIHELTAQAPEEVGELVDNEQATEPELTEQERKDLESLIALAQRRLNRGKAQEESH